MALPKFAPVPVPGPRALPVVGVYQQMYKLFKDPIDYLSKLHGEYGTIASIQRNNPYMVQTLSPEYNKLLLSDPKLFHTSDANALPMLDPATATALSRISYGVTQLNGKPHVKARRLIMPAVHHQALPVYRDEMVNISSKFVEGWQKGTTLDVFREMQKLTLKIAMKVLLGITPDGRSAEALGQLYQDWMKANSSLPSNLLFPFDLPGTPLRKLLRLSEVLEKHTKEAIAERRANPTGKDVLSMLIQARDEDGGTLSEIELIGNTHMLFIIGHQTMTDVLTWTLFLLSQHPQVLSDLEAEIDGELRGGPPSFEQFANLKMLDHVLHESMRLLGPTIFQYRIPQQPVQIGPYELPAKVWLGFSPHFTHRIPEIWPEPQRFNPRRWETFKPSPFEYLPFTYGAHGCIGQAFAMMEMKLVLISLIQRVRLALSPDARVDRGIDPTLYPKHGMKMMVLGRDQTLPLHPAKGDVREMVDLPN